MIEQATFTFAVSQNVPNGGTVAVSYSPTVRDTIDTRGVASHILVVDDNNDYQFTDGEFGLTFGDTAFTITNLTGQSWPIGTRLTIGLAYAGTGYGGDFLFDFNVFNHHITSTAYTLRRTDNGKALVFEADTNVTVTLPNTMPEGFSCLLIQRGQGQVLCSAQSGASPPLVNRQGATQTAGRYATATVLVLANANGSQAQWLLGGDVA